MVWLLPLSWKGVNSGVSRKRPLRTPSSARKLPILALPKPGPPGPPGRAKGAVGGVDIAKQPRHAQAGACGDVGDQAALVAKLGIRRTGYHLHALDGTGGKLGRKDFALLVA